MTMPILFCHGLESGPHGRKYHALTAAGFDVVSPDCRQRSLAERIEILKRTIEEVCPALVIGSSFGGIAGLCAVIDTHPGSVRSLLLCAPALQLPPPPSFTGTLGCPVPTTIIHGTRDEVIPIDLSRTFAATHRAHLIEVDDDHSLAASLPQIITTTRSLG